MTPPLRYANARFDCDKLNEGAAAWSIVKFCPAAVRVALRDVTDVFRDTVNASVPLPVPLAPDGKAIILALLVDALQAQPADPVTVADRDSPANATWAAELSERQVRVDGEYVRRRLAPVLEDEDLSRYIL